MWNTLVNHEYFHARDKFEGMNLSDKVRLDGKNIEELPDFFGRFHPIDVRRSLEDTRAYLNELREIRKLKDKRFRGEVKGIKRTIRGYKEIFKEVLEKELADIKEPNRLSLVGRVSELMLQEIERELVPDLRI